MNDMPSLDGQLRQAALFMVQDVQRILNQIEELLCLTEEEDKNEGQTQSGQD